jgi:FKBP-type peptidyl-prolyl cis-trans isomerase FkpA
VHAAITMTPRRTLDLAARLSAPTIEMKKLVFLLLAIGVAGACNNNVLGAGAPSDPTREAFAASLGVDISTFARTESGVYYKDIRVGTGDQAEAADDVTITYAGYLKDGTLIDSKSTPTKLSLTIFITGFRDGVIGMRVGGVRKLVIPSALGYSWQGRTDNAGKVIIPRNATLVFDVELFAVTKPATTTQ